MRYYDIKILEPGSAEVIRHWTSYAENLKTSLPSAQNIELDIPHYLMGETSGTDAYVRIWGIPLSDISQSSDFTLKNIVIKAGFQKGLPLANPSQSGVIAKGMITNSFGNWVGTRMTLDLYLAAGSAQGLGDGGTGSAEQPKNIVLNWTKGKTLSGALESALGSAFPNYTTDIKVDDTLVASEDLVGPYHTLSNLAKFVSSKSKAIKSGSSDYRGVQIWMDQDTIYASDFTQPADDAVTDIKFEELIGQPTYGVPSGYEIQFICPMRADLKIGSKIRLPNTAVVTTASAQSGILNQTALKNQSIFKGVFVIKSVRHIGEFRQSDGQAWATVFNAYANRN